MAACLAAASVAAAVLAARPAPEATVDVVTAARDLHGGTRLTGEDLRVRSVPADAAPEGALRAGGTGRVLATPMREGEPMTDVRLLGRSLAKGYGPDRVAAPVRIADPSKVALLRVGDRIDVLAASTEPGEAARPARTVLRRAPVIAVPRGADGAGGADDAASGPNPLSGAGPVAAGASDGGLVVVATTRKDAAALASAATTARLSLVVGS